MDRMYIQYLSLMCYLIFCLKIRINVENLIRIRKLILIIFVTFMRAYIIIIYDIY